MKRAVFPLALVVMSAAGAFADTYVPHSDSIYVPIPVVLIHGMNSAPDAWTTLTEKLQPLLQHGSLTTPSSSFRYGLPPSSPQLESPDTDPAVPDLHSYFQTAHYGRHRVLEGILDQSGDTITEPMLALKSVSVWERDDNIRSVLESVNAALKMQKDLGVPPNRRFVILVAHSTGGIAIRKFMQDMGNIRPSQQTSQPALADMGAVTYESVVQRILYVDVPHYGSPGANYLVHLARVTVSGCHIATFDICGTTCWKCWLCKSGSSWI